MDDSLTLPAGLELRPDDLRRGIIQRKPVAQHKLHIPMYGPIRGIDEEETHFVHHHCEGVYICFHREARAFQAELLWKKQFRGEPTDRPGVTF